MENQGLLFIPDISGFTKFVHETEIDHSSLIIKELLEVLINANQIGLEISEIEGDAILFYKFGERPSLQDIYLQVERMFQEFHRSLLVYDNRRFCQCVACKSAVNLTLKVITHYGEFTGYNVKNFNKLIGRDIIVAHQLLKNDIEQHEYWLVTQNLLQGQNPTEFTKWMQWSRSAKETEIGSIPFQYTGLTELKAALPDDVLPPVELNRKAKMMSISREYATDIITLFHASGDYKYRSQWMEGVKKVEEVSHFLPRIGTRYRCVLKNGVVTTYASSYRYEADRIQFSESNEQNKDVLLFILQKKGRGRSSLTIEYYIPRSFLSQFMFSVLRKKYLENRFNKSLTNLAEIASNLKIPSADLQGLQP